jgi:gas vesicle protein
MKIGRYLIGLVSGLTFGMLFATKKGKDLRKEIFEKGSDSHMDGLKALGNAFKGAGADAMAELKKMSEHEDIAALLEVSHDKMRGFLDAAQDHGYDVAAYVQEKLEGLACMAKDKASELKGGAEQFQKRAVRKAGEVRDEVAEEVSKKVSHVKKAVAKKAGKLAKRK